MPEKSNNTHRRSSHFPYQTPKIPNCNNMISPNRKRKRSPCPKSAAISDPFDSLPDDLVLHLLSRLAASASSPSDLLNALFTCKRFNRLVLHPLVLSNAGPEAISVQSKKWCDSAHQFLKRCVDAGSIEACYTLGMIRYYCLGNRESGASLMAKAAIKSHAPALYSLAVIQFNGSGGAKSGRGLQAGVALCARAASLGHVDALRELGHCLQDGYGVRRNPGEGRRFIIQANARELAAGLLSSSSSSRILIQDRHHRFESILDLTVMSFCSLLNDFGADVPAPEPHPVHRFLRDWFESERGVEGRGAMRLCAYGGCGRAETRANEFRRCSFCGVVNYCSRGCQTHDWKVGHNDECMALRYAAAPLFHILQRPDPPNNNLGIL